MAQRAVSIDGMTPDERLELLERLWDSLSSRPADVPFTDAQRLELGRRLDALDEDIAEGRTLGVPWDEVLRQIRSAR